MHWTWQRTGFCLLPWGLGEVKQLLGIKWKPLNTKNTHLPQGTGLESSEMILVSGNHYMCCLSSFKVQDRVGSVASPGAISEVLGLSLIWQQHSSGQSQDVWTLPVRQQWAIFIFISRFLSLWITV